MKFSKDMTPEVLATFNSVVTSAMCMIEEVPPEERTRQYLIRQTHVFEALSHEKLQVEGQRRSLHILLESLRAELAMQPGQPWRPPVSID